MARYLIDPNDSYQGPRYLENDDKNVPALRISECFYDAIQGEGVYSGCPAIFLRLQGCHLGCSWCDSTDLWKKGVKYSVTRLVKEFRDAGLIEKLENGHHLVITGGSPLLQQDDLMAFVNNLCQECKNKPFIEIETDATILVEKKNLMLFYYIDCWNCSPKLASSKIDEEKRYRPEAIEQIMKTSQYQNTWFKFVIDKKTDWKEIDEKYLKPGLIKKYQVILMPAGANQVQLTTEKKLMVVDLAVEKGVRYGGRLHIDLWNDKKGV